MDRSTIQVEGRQVNLSPGMAVTVEIKTGHFTGVGAGVRRVAVRILRREFVDRPLSCESMWPGDLSITPVPSGAHSVRLEQEHP